MGDQSRLIAIFPQSRMASEEWFSSRLLSRARKPVEFGAQCTSELQHSSSAFPASLTAVEPAMFLALTSRFSEEELGYFLTCQWPFNDAHGNNYIVRGTTVVVECSCEERRMTSHRTLQWTTLLQTDLRMARIRWSRRYDRDILGDWYTIKTNLPNDQRVLGESPAPRNRLEPKGRM